MEKKIVYFVHGTTYDNVLKKYKWEEAKKMIRENKVSRIQYGYIIYKYNLKMRVEKFNEYKE